jgi:putative lipoprotein
MPLMTGPEPRTALVALAIATLAVAPAGAGATISGTATYRERMLLPPGAVFEATLEDVSRADAPATILGRALLESPTGPPFPFAIDYDPTAVDARHRYVVRARITLEGRLLFSTDAAYPVLGPDGPTQVELLLKRVGAGAPPPPAPGPARGSADPASVAPVPPLESTYWRLVSLRGEPVRLAEKQREAHLILQPDGRLAGSGGCNQLVGSYTLDGDQLSFGRTAGTMMACPPDVMERERAFLEALSQVVRWRIRGQQLELLDGQLGPVALFDAVHLR